MPPLLAQERTPCMLSLLTAKLKVVNSTLPPQCHSPSNGQKQFSLHYAFLHCSRLEPEPRRPSFPLGVSLCIAQESFFTPNCCRLQERCSTIRWWWLPLMENISCTLVGSALTWDPLRLPRAGLPHWVDDDRVTHRVQGSSNVTPSLTQGHLTRKNQYTKWKTILNTCQQPVIW